MLAVAQSRRVVDCVVVDDLPEDEGRSWLAHHTTDDRNVLVADHRRRLQTDDTRSI